MKHEIDPTKWGEYGKPMADAIQSCVHCGFCLPTCPTYDTLGQEADSPRGRILLMKEVLEGKATFEEVKPHVDRCLGCVACETACPSGVKYGELLSPFRQHADAKISRRGWDRLRHWLIFQSLPFPKRFRIAMRLGRWGKWLRPLMPASIRPMVSMIPNRLPKQIPLQEHYPVKGTRRGKVALLAGCAQQVLRPEINLATIRVLNRNQIEVVIPQEQTCCGALAWHAGHPSQGKQFATKNLEVFSKVLDDVDAVLTNAAGCGSGLQDYRTVLRESESQERLKAFTEKCMDVSVYLDELGLVEIPRLKKATRVAYHDACHLLHAQKVKYPPRRLLEQVPELTVVELPNAGSCCGSAGTYNLDQPELAAELGSAKGNEVRSVDPDLVVTGNIGCQVQLEQHLQAADEDRSIPVLHTLELLDRAYRGKSLV